MQRKTALATAAAITMGVGSALFAVGAGTGAFGAAPSAPTADVSQVRAASRATSEPRSDDEQRLAPNTDSTRGEFDD
jgi:hypothetical protein